MPTETTCNQPSETHVVSQKAIDALLDVSYSGTPQISSSLTDLLTLTSLKLFSFYSTDRHIDRQTNIQMQLVNLPMPLLLSVRLIMQPTV